MVVIHARDGIARGRQPVVVVPSIERLTIWPPLGGYRLAMLKQLALAVGGDRGVDDGQRWTPRTADAVLALLLTVLAQIELLLADVVEGPMLLQSLSFMAMTASVAWRRSFPLLAATLAAAGLATQTVGGDAEVVGGFLALIIVTYSVASYAALKPALVGGALMLAAVFLYPFLRGVSFADEVGNAAIFVGAWCLGRMVRSRQGRALHAQALLEAAEREHLERTRQIVSEERARIARELHDIVAHGVSLMVLQCGAARQTAERDPSTAKDLLASAEGQGRQALAELQRMLGILRTSDAAEIVGPESISSVDQLVEGLRAAGLRVDYRVEGEQRPLATGLELSAYRIVQEATTNIVKHAAASSAEICIRYGPERLELCVKDDGRGSDGPGIGIGHGLVGMKERASLFGGSVTAGVTDAGGWSVAAHLLTEDQP